jgi:uncharacterized repeat protein (TIGR03943 family)
MRTLDRLKALILILTAIYAANLLVGGALYGFIAPRLSWVIGIAVAVFILAAGAYNIGASDAGRKSTGVGVGTGDILAILVLALPLAFGIVVPTHTLDATDAARHGIELRYDGIGFAQRAIPDVGGRSVLDWATVVAASSDPQALDGQSAEFVGFVYHDTRTAASQFIVTRFAMPGRVVDAVAVGVVVESNAASQFADNDWVRVVGTFQQGELGGDKLPILIASDVIPSQQAQPPYLYP